MRNLYLNEDGEDDEETVAATYTKYDPCLIVFFVSKNEESFLHIDDEMLTLTQLLHEMVHQYNAQKGIEDADENSHKEIFFQEASRHGLENGYHLSEEAELKIESFLSNLKKYKEKREIYRIYNKNGLLPS